MKKSDEKRTAAQWFAEGIRCFHKPDGVGAVRAFENVIDQDPVYRHEDGDNAYFYLGKIYEVEGRCEEAIALYTRALALDPWDEESLIGRGSCLTVQNQHDRAIADFKNVTRIPAKLRNAPLKHIYYAIAENYRKQGDYGHALKWGKMALERDPENYRISQLVTEMADRLQKK
jgi:tetratricopeptide (TPR) repeat protein